MLRRKAAAAMTALLALGLARGSATAGEGSSQDSKRVSVTARGQATGAADALEIEFTVTAHTEEAGEAEKKFRDKLARVTKALKEGEVTTSKKKSSDDDDDDPPPVKKKKTTTTPPPKATPTKT